jgi:uracil-DNA glycosylase family protein
VSAEEFLPESRDLAALRRAAKGCKGCPLWAPATQTVFGEGPADVQVVLVGEQPGDREDREGRPFVGPAGRVLDRALDEAGIDRGATYVTNAVKHFKFVERGKRRLHKNPSRSEVVACRPWLDAELAALSPEVVVPMGAVAAQALLGPSFRVTRQRGEVLPLDGDLVAVATVHPSSILRGPEEDREQNFAALVGDLEVVADLLS